MINYEKKSLFDVTGKAILVHAVNCKGVMGSGIAKEFKQRFPEAFERYNKECMTFGDKLVGRGNIYATKNVDISMGCLFTSRGFGKTVDSPDKIIRNTQTALAKFFEVYKSLGYDKDGFHIYSNKFNSGLFNVTWGNTEALIHDEIVKHPGIVWTVCDPQQPHLPTV